MTSHQGNFRRRRAMPAPLGPRVGHTPGHLSSKSQLRRTPDARGASPRRSQKSCQAKNHSDHRPTRACRVHGWRPRHLRLAVDVYYDHIHLPHSRRFTTSARTSAWPAIMVVGLAMRRRWPDGWQSTDLQEALRLRETDHWWRQRCPAPGASPTAPYPAERVTARPCSRLI